MAALERLAPKSWAEDWDNVGLQVGSLQGRTEKVLLTLDVTPAVVNKAAETGAKLVISHHPPVFRPLRSVRTDLNQGAVIAAALKYGLVIYSAHTNLDSSPAGVNAALAEVLELPNPRILLPVYEQLYKIVVFVPTAQEAELREAIGNAGAGFIGNYSHCTYRVQGKGTFFPHEGTHPFIGQPGKLEEVDETRIETIVPEGQLRQVISAMLRTHPYEEPAYDIYRVENQGPPHGAGRISELDAPVELHEFVLRAVKLLKTRIPQLASSGKTMIKRVAIMGGSGGDYAGAAADKGADLYITGECHYHIAQEVTARGMNVLTVGHYESEQMVWRYVAPLLERELKAGDNGLEFIIYDQCTSPFVPLATL